MQKEIVVVTPSLGNAGAERVLAKLMDAWVCLDCKVYLIQTDSNFYKNKYVISPKIEKIDFNIKSKTRFGARLERIKRLCLFFRKHPNAVGIAIVNPAILILGVSSLFVNNYIMFSERCDPNSSPSVWWRRLGRDLLYNLADVCIFQTEDAKKHFNRFIQSKGYIIQNPSNPNLPERYLGVREKKIVAVCSLIKQKNIPMMIRACAKLFKVYPEYQLVIYGEGPERTNLENLIKSLDMVNNIFMPGFTPNVFDEVVKSSVYVSSSDYEGISNSMLEALGMGVPSVVTDCPIGGARITIENNINGILVPVGNSDSMYKALLKIIREPDFAQKLSDNAYLQRNKFPVEVIAKQWLALMP